MTFFPFAPAPPREAAPPAVVGPGDSALTVTLPHQLCEAGEGPGVGQTQWVTVLQPEALTPSFLHRGRSPKCGLPALARPLATVLVCRVAFARRARWVAPAAIFPWGP